MATVSVKKSVRGVYYCYIGLHKYEVFDNESDAAKWLYGKIKEYAISPKSDIAILDVIQWRLKNA